MPGPVQAGHELLVDLFDGTVHTPIVVKWQQNFVAREASYYRVKAYNKNTGETVPLFIATEFYKSATASNPNHITKVGQLLPGEGYVLKVDSKIQYGQKNAEGVNRFLVFHDKERKPFQHRFIETAVLSTLAKSGEAAAAGVLAKFGLTGTASAVADLAKAYIGDYLRTF
ncbi:hypothetical protein B0H67DRAFT_641415 [Lasiosphaeris hirsuta]|uniref:Uncharacterized protein n=1 Tax=Lasiosphaeris hirsuta TaxID=260670 RepID=A0AA40E755_9PEZI|nr:hypothetical protein B0H67DRAFT_641415 [Lasiosphaeris hirsuta]